ncbi:OPT superfamily oligopeptide transporter [Rhizoclosmatium globosum]|uniref:OPT superfamily oligopeptide transporter n=1 Tax=Rhizoclosmatium globosum TaxID=329046 RepID=A0A1Y2BQT8_9FUNG|nr:OPT superfamily oligopeptide transporter [Rhizoclosmatium globosum]|eukprot:ORY37108.1 OPT superfamily oligopeptide transporter [Rhizoclosmatium globosum]
MTKTADIVAEKEHQLDDLKHEHPELEDDVEISDIKEVEERIDFIVPQTDDPSTPAFTFRSVLLGTIWITLLSFANTALSFRTVAFGIGANVALILSYPMGLFLAAVLPKSIPLLNPGPFSLKEHVLIYIMASCGGVPYGIDNVVAQVMPDLMGNEDITFLHSLGFVFVTQFLGYGLSGLTRRFLVRPTAMWWPGNLSTIALFTSFHKVETGEIDAFTQRYTTSRFKAFWIAFAAMFVWTFIPQYFAQTLQAISLLCLIAGRGDGPSGKLTQFNLAAGSVYNGVGVLGITFDWTYVGSYVFTSPFWALLVNFGGTIIFQWIIAPLLYANDVWGLNQIITKDTVNRNPLLNTPHLFVGNANGTKRQGTRVKPNYFFDATKNYDLNITAYNDVAPVHITSYFALVYGCSFLTITSAISHVGLWYGKDIYRQSMNAFRQIRDEVDALDKHVKLMEAYPDVPDWAYLAFLGFTTVAALLVSIFTPFNMPWWGIFFNLFLCAIFILPFGIVPAISGFGLYLNVLTEFVIGLMIPGQTVAVMAFKSWGTNNLIQALTLTQDLKLGQYLHIPPYAMVFAQFWGTFVNVFVSSAACWFMMFGSKDLLQKDEWQYNGYQTFYSAGGIWGAIGPQRFFGIGSLYEGLLWCFLIGFIAPFGPWLANRYLYKSKYWHYVNFSIIFTIGSAGYPQVSIVVPVILTFVAQWIFVKNKEFYQKYLYVIGSGFDAAGGFVSLIVSFLFFADINPPNWILNPNTDNVKSDWYCYPGSSWDEYDCAYYLKAGKTKTPSGIVCKK